MYLIIIGSGPLGESMVELALNDGHDVALIEEDADRAQHSAQRYDCLVLQASVAQGGILEEAKAEQADAIIATTEDDSANLMAMFLGSEHGIRVLVSVVNEPGHAMLFKRLGVHILLDPEVIIAKYLYRLVCQPELRDIVPLPNGAQVFEVELAPHAALVGKTLVQVGKLGLLPKHTLIVSVHRGTKTIVPCGQTQLEAGDGLTVFTQAAMDDKMLKVFKG